MEVRIAELARRLGELRRAGGNKIKAGLPSGLRAEILSAWRESGMPMGPFGVRIGVSGQSIANWRKATARQKVKNTAKPKKKFREIRVVPETSPKASPPQRSYELALPGGARVSGLGMEDIAQLLGMKGVAR